MSNLPMDPIRYTRKDVDRLLARKSKWTVQETQKILDSCFFLRDINGKKQ